MRTVQTLGLPLNFMEPDFISLVRLLCNNFAITKNFHFLFLFCNRKSEIEAKRKQEEEERKKREEEEKRIQVMF